MSEDLFSLYDYLENDEATDEIIAACKALYAVMKKHGAYDHDTCRLITEYIWSMGAFEAAT
jgi:hypothetical protein